MILGELPEIPWSMTLFVAGGLFGLVLIATAILNLYLACKKAFGKNPPLHEELKAMRAEFTAALRDCQDKTRISVAGAYKKIEEERKDREEAFADLALERARTIKSIDEAVLLISKDIAFMRGQISNKK